MRKMWIITISEKNTIGTDIIKCVNWRFCKMNNTEIKSVYDPKLMKQKRFDSAKKMVERLGKEKDLVYIDKSKTFFGVKNSDKKNVGYYAVQQIKESYGCNCFDYVKYIEIQEDFECKHILFIRELIKQKKKKDCD